MLNAVLGFFAGLVAGFLPGFYITNLLPLNSSFEFIVCSTISFLFATIFPSVFLCAPNSSNQLIVIPAFKFLKQGKALKSADISLLTSLFSILIFIFFIFFSQVFLQSIYTVLQIFIFGILCISLIFLCNGKNSLIILALSAFLGILLLDFNMLVPMLSGFFGFSTLLISFKTFIPHQKIKKFHISKFNILKISCFSSFLSFIFAFVPAVSSTILASLTKFFGKLNTEEFMVFTVSTNMYYMLFSFLGVFLLQKARSGPAFFLMATLENQDMFYLVFLILISSFTAFYILNHIKICLLKFFQTHREKILIFSVFFILFFNFIFYGFFGLLVLITATFIALFAYKLNVRKITCMASLIVPTLLILWLK